MDIIPEVKKLLADMEQYGTVSVSGPPEWTSRVLYGVAHLLGEPPYEHSVCLSLDTLEEEPSVEGVSAELSRVLGFALDDLGLRRSDDWDLDQEVGALLEWAQAEPHRRVVCTVFPYEVLYWMGAEGVFFLEWLRGLVRGPFRLVLAGEDDTLLRPCHDYPAQQPVQPFAWLDPTWLEYTGFGDVARKRLGQQCQCASRTVDGRCGYPDLGFGLRFRGDASDYHGLYIHRADVDEFVRRYQNWKQTCDALQKPR